MKKIDWLISGITLHKAHPVLTNTFADNIDQR